MPPGPQQAFLRGDGAGIHTVETADYKAYTALSFRIDGIDLVERSKNRPPSRPRSPNCRGCCSRRVAC